MVEIIIKLPKLESKLEEHIVKGIETLAKAEVARAVMLERLDKMLSKSKLTDDECIKLGRLAKKGRAKELREMGLL